MNRATARYWRQVHAVQEMTGASSAIARKIVGDLRSERGYTTAAETRRHPIIVNRAAEAVETRERAPYKDLDDWIDTFEEWEGDHDYFDVETNADY